MAVAKMKKVSVVADKGLKEAVLLTLQGMKNIHLTSLEDWLPEEGDEPSAFALAGHKEAEIQADQKLNDIQEALSFLAEYQESLSFMEKMKARRPQYTMPELEGRVEGEMDLEAILTEVTSAADAIEAGNHRIKEMREKEAELRKWVGLTVDPHRVRYYEAFTVLAGTLADEYIADWIQDLRDLETVVIKEIYRDRDEANFMLVFPKQTFQDVQEVLRRYHFRKYAGDWDQKPQDQLDALLKAIDKELDQVKAIKKDVRSMDSNRQALELAYEYYYSKRERAKALAMSLDSDHLFVLSGWAPAADLEAITAKFTDQVASDQLAIVIEDIQEEDIPEVPIALDNPGFIQPFETLTKQYGLPLYNELDPTPWMYPFQLVFFGMMSADAGYGLLLWAATFFALKKFELGPGLKQNLRMFNQMSLATIVIGLIFGSFFGFSLPVVLIDVQTDVVKLLVIAVSLGLIQLMLGYGLQIYQHTQAGDLAASYLEGWQWLLMLLGVVVLGVNAALTIHPLLETVGLALILVNVLGMFVVHTWTHSNKFAGFAQGLFGLMDIASLLGDAVSYTRLAALAISGASIGAAFNLILGLIPPIGRFTVGLILFVLLHGLNLFITFLGAYVHSMRLEYVEFFGKFFSGQGKPFSPLRPLEKYIWIHKDK